MHKANFPKRDLHGTQVPQRSGTAVWVNSVFTKLKHTLYVGGFGFSSSRKTQRDVLRSRATVVMQFRHDDYCWSSGNQRRNCSYRVKIYKWSWQTFMKLPWSPRRIDASHCPFNCLCVSTYDHMIYVLGWVKKTCCSYVNKNFNQNVLSERLLKNIMSLKRSIFDIANRNSCAFSYSPAALRNTLCSFHARINLKWTSTWSIKNTTSNTKRSKPPVGQLDAIPVWPSVAKSSQP